MIDFFTLNPLASENISFIETLIPIIVLIILLLIIFLMRYLLRNNSVLDKRIRYVSAVISSAFLLLYYLLLWNESGIKPDTLPLHLCFISNILSIILCIRPSKKLFNILIYTGVLGGISSLIFPDLQLSSKYFRYYQFMICHVSIILIPIYFAIVYKLTPSFKDTFYVFIFLQIIGIPLGIFNSIFNTNYMFISFSSNIAAKDSILINLGTGYNYFLNLELLAAFSLLLSFIFICLIKTFINKKTVL